MHPLIVQQISWTQVIDPNIFEVVVVDAEPSRVLRLFVEQVNHAELICLRGIPFRKTPSFLNFPALFLILQYFTFHAISDLIFFEKAELVRWQEFGNVRNFVGQICVLKVV